MMRKKAGLTLLEIILVVAVMAIIMIAMAPYLRSIHVSWRYGDRRTEMLQHGRVSLDRMVKAIRAAGSITDIDASGTGDYLAITNQDSEPITFFHNVPTSPYYVAPSGVIEDNDIIMQTEDNKGNPVNNPLARSVSTLTFTYLKPSMDQADPATSTNEVQAVRIDLSISDPEGIITGTLPLSSLAYCRVVKVSDTWARVFTRLMYEAGVSVQQTSDGGYITAGWTAIGLGFDGYVIKTNEYGEIQWSKTFGGSGSDWVSSVQQTSDGGYIIAGYTDSFGAGLGDIYLIKTNESGEHQWSKTFGGSDLEGVDGAYPAQQTSDGGYIIAGWTRSFDAGTSDAYLIKTNESGEHQWSKTFSGNGGAVAKSVQQTSDGGYIIAGATGGDAYLIKTNESGEHQWSKTFGGSSDDLLYSAQETSDGGYITTGLTVSFGAGSYDVYLIKTDDEGEHQWSKTFGSVGWDSGGSVQQTSDGGYIIAGAIGADAYLIKTNELGEHQWSRIFGGSSDDAVYSAQQTSDRGYITTGETWSFNAGGSKVYLIKTDADGNCPEADNPTEVVDNPEQSPETPTVEPGTPTAEDAIPVADPSVPEHDPGEPS